MRPRASDPAERYASMLDVVRAAIRDTQAPAGFSSWSCRLRKSRDEDILQGLAADLRARMIEARAAQ